MATIDWRNQRPAKQKIIILLVLSIRYLEQYRFLFPSLSLSYPKRHSLEYLIIITLVIFHLFMYCYRIFSLVTSLLFPGYCIFLHLVCEEKIKTSPPYFHSRSDSLSSIVNDLPTQFFFIFSRITDYTMVYIPRLAKQLISIFSKSCLRLSWLFLLRLLSLPVHRDTK